MTGDANKALLRHFFEEADGGNFDVYDEVCAEDYQCHYPPTLVPGALSREQHKQFAKDFYAAFPDLRHTVEELVAEGDTVAFRLTNRATHIGEFQGHPGTGKPITFGVMGMARIRDGRLVEVRVEADLLGFMQQVGAVPVQATS